MNDVKEVLHAVVAAELRAWVPGASQRLIRRAADRMGIETNIGRKDVTECAPGQHCLTYDWIAGFFVLRCSTCDHLTRS